VVSKLLLITDGCTFCNSKETDSNRGNCGTAIVGQQSWERTAIGQQSCWQSFQFRFNSSAEIVCSQPNFNCKLFVISRILVEFLVYVNSANPNISRIFFQPSVFFRFQIGGLDDTVCPRPPLMTQVQNFVSRIKKRQI